MNREELKKLAKEEFINNTMKHLDSALIFTYIQNLEQKENNLQSKIDKAIDKINQYEIISGHYDSNYDGIEDTYSHDIKEELLDILKEVENVENN